MTELAREKSDNAVGAPIQALRLADSHRLSLSAAGETGSLGPFDELSSVVRIYTSADIAITIRPDGQVSETGTVIPGGSVEYFAVLPLDLVNVYALSDGGANVNVTEC